jgi:hypothetical protein
MNISPENYTQNQKQTQENVRSQNETVKANSIGLIQRLREKITIDRFIKEEIELAAVRVAIGLLSIVVAANLYKNQS